MVAEMPETQPVKTTEVGKLDLLPQCFLRSNFAFRAQLF